jgi:hypothetical protein
VRWVSAVPLGLAIASTHPALADDDASVTRVAPCRPTVTCIADLAPPGTLEVEVGFELRRSGGAGTETIPLLVELPVAGWLELQVGDAGYTVTPASSYVDNVTLGAKVHIADQNGARPSLAVTATASLPTAAQTAYAHVTDGFVVAQASKDYGKLHLDANAGLDAWRLEGSPLYQPYAAVAASLPVTDRLSATVEPHAFADASPIAPRDIGVIAAVGFTARPWLVVDAAVDATVVEPTAIAGLVGVSIAPVRLWGTP